MYSKDATSEPARKIRDLIASIKAGRIELQRRRPYADLAVERMAARLTAPVRDLFSGRVMLVPVPRSGLTRPNTVWSNRTVCEALVSHGLGTSVQTVLTRVVAVPKSAGRVQRPPLSQHFASLSVQGMLDRASRILLVDDVVTTGTTLMAAARRVAEANPGIEVAAFALARVQSDEPLAVFAPAIEFIEVRRNRCHRHG